MTSSPSRGTWTRTGCWPIPDAPGLGVALDFDRVAHYARGERLPVAR